eukprot:CAMPEP_0182600014 /NCGR_PEP_ID=MMETSP1324-20130603/90773_1 /TAXON_ID=236786 /ORGANISM="Florenciella sp., Strain RCC1587" /LENGTH=146 /DNA_ID=CAMNT_0024817923 /DNA_START=259 /DNA_END=699 /DNA_ORIENTATION=+
MSSPLHRTQLAVFAPPQALLATTNHTRTRARRTSPMFACPALAKLEPEGWSERRADHHACPTYESHVCLSWLSWYRIAVSDMFDSGSASTIFGRSTILWHMPWPEQSLGHSMISQARPARWLMHLHTPDSRSQLPAFEHSTMECPF